MSNFLNNLVARTLNLGPVVQPRLTSWFEPVAPVATVAPLEESVEVEGALEPLSTRPLEQRAPVALVLPHPDRDHTRENLPHVTVQPEHVQSREAVQPRIDTIRNTLLVPPPQNFITHEIERLPASEPPLRPATRITPERADSPREAKPVQTPVRTESESWRQLQPRVQSLIDSRLSAVQPARTNDRVPEKTATVQPNVARSIPRNEAPPAASPRAEQHPAFQPEPSETINVTIGRVDVRAVFSQQTAAPPARPRTSTVNSLDDYLRQRSEGRR